MGHSVKKVKRGKKEIFGIYSTIVDDFIVVRNTLEELREAYLVQQIEDFKKSFTLRWERMTRGLK